MSAPGDGSVPASSVLECCLPAAVTVGERRVQPRHCHGQPSPAAAADAVSAGGDVNEMQPDHSSPAARLYRHALESIFAFLNRRELVTALRVSHNWLSAVKSMASLQLTLEQPSAAMLRVIAESVMGRHVTQLGPKLSRVLLTADVLIVVARGMPQLRELDCRLQLTPTLEPLAFPSGLQKLTLRITDTPTAADVNAALLAISRLPLLESFTMDLLAIDSQLSFAPLATTPRLRHLCIHGPSGNADLSDAQVAQLRALPLLRRLDVQPISTSQLGRLLAQPHQLQWQEMTLPRPLTDDAAALLLPQLPSLTTMLVILSGSLFEWLQRLPNLTRVSLAVDHEGAESLVAALRRCTQIRHLSLHCRGLRAAHLMDLLPRLPRLHTLALDSVDIDSLSFLAQRPMTQQLADLTLLFCKKLPLTELCHVTALKGLQSLQLCYSFSTPMNAHYRSLFTSPSAALPQLQKFVCT